MLPLGIKRLPDGSVNWKVVLDEQNKSIPYATAAGVDYLRRTSTPRRQEQPRTDDSHVLAARAVGMASKNPRSPSTSDTLATSELEYHLERCVTILRLARGPLPDHLQRYISQIAAFDKLSREPDVSRGRA